MSDSATFLSLSQGHDVAASPWDRYSPYERWIVFIRLPKPTYQDKDGTYRHGQKYATGVKNFARVSGGRRGSRGGAIGSLLEPENMAVLK